MYDIVSPLLQWLNAHPNLASIGTFIISAAESVAIIGTIIPGSVMMTAIGALAGAGVIPLWPTIIWATIGAIVGDGISYKIGYHFKDRLHNVWPFRTRPNLLKQGELFFEKNGAMSVFIGRFVGPVRALVPLIAGMLGMRPLRFYIANVLSAIGWAPAYMLPGILMGIASLELPPDIAVHAMLIILLGSLFGILCLWLIYKFFVLINNRINNFLTRVWTRLGDSRFFHPITTILKHYNPQKTHGQLTLALYLIVTSLLFLYLANYVQHTGSQTIFINHSLYYLLRSLRNPITDQIMIACTFLGEKFVLLPLSVTLFVYLGYQKRWRTAWHILALGVLAAVGIEFFKHIIHSPRPWGIQVTPTGSSFPSGHSGLAIVFYSGICLLLLKSLQIRSRRFLYSSIFLIIFAVGVSRIYLGAHWFTDVIGAWLYGAIVLMMVILSYNRKAEQRLAPKGIIITIFVTLFLTYGIYFFTHYSAAKTAYARINWPSYSISQTSWWTQQGQHLPIFRINRFGLSDEVLNLQWHADFATIKSTLLHNGWEIAPTRDWISVLHRLSDVQSSEHVPLVSPLYLDKKPALVLVKRISDNKRLIVLRLWDSHAIIQNSATPLWVGTVSAVPRTYSWLFNHTRGKKFIFSANTLFTKTPTHLSIKQFVVKNSHNKEQPMILLESK